jgi:hypothetical protein
MPRSQPDAPMLLGVTVEYLDKELYPKLSGPERFRTRVAINVLRIVQRELEQGPSLDEQERDDLRTLLGETGADADPLDLTRQITSGERSIDDPALVAFLQRALERALRVNNPGWIKP